MNKIFNKSSIIFSLITMIYLFFLMLFTKDNRSADIMKLSLVYVVLIIINYFLMIRSVRRAIVSKSDDTCRFLDLIISKKAYVNFNVSEDTLYSKEQSKLKDLIKMLESEKRMYEEEKKNIQSLITDLSHQLKTPLANLLIYNSTLIERDVDKETKEEFLLSMKNEIIRLQWLIEGLIKISRLENEIISINMKVSSIEDTIAMAISGVYSKALEKNININVNCNGEITCNHDKKWTSEAILNIIENAIKYSDEYKDIHINVQPLEVFIRIDIIDNGIGISIKEVNNIFKRFYRSKDVSEYQGIGIGLYLSREIISKQGGYIRVNSNFGKGSTFSIFLLKD